jgi:O-antigen ligase
MLLKIEKILFYLFLILIPFQIRYFFLWGGNEWNSVFLYLGDVIFAAILLLAILRKGIGFEKKDIFLLLFMVIAAISLFATSSLGISAFRLVKLIEFVLLYIYICRNIGFIGINRVLSVIFYSGVFQSILAIAQFIKQGSIGIKFVEAGVYNPNSPGVANFVLNGEKILRSYGSFPHPNVLAGFLLMAIFCFYGLFLQREFKGNSKEIKGNLIFLVIVFGLFLTFSRTVIVVFLIGSLVMFLTQILKRMKIIKLFGLFLVSCILVIIILFPYFKARFFTVSLDEQAIDLRFFYNKMALSMIKDKPLLGIGIGNFVNYSKNYETYLRAAGKFVGESKGVPDWVFQPVHNIYLLIGSEIGIIGLLAFLGFIILNIWRSNLLKEVRPLALLFIGFLIIALADHYFWTLQQGGIMFWLALALVRKE